MTVMPSAQRHFLVKVSGIDGYFASKSGGNVGSAATKVWPGGSITPALIAAPAEADNITIGREYDYDRDHATLVALKQRIGRHTATISVTPTDIDMVAKGDPDVYPDALLVGMSIPDVDSSSGDAARWELEFAIGAFR